MATAAEMNVFDLSDIEMEVIKYDRNSRSALWRISPTSPIWHTILVAIIKFNAVSAFRYVAGSYWTLITDDLVKYLICAKKTDLLQCLRGRFPLERYLGYAVEHDFPELLDILQINTDSLGHLTPEVVARITDLFDMSSNDRGMQLIQYRAGLRRHMVLTNDEIKMLQKQRPSQRVFLNSIIGHTFTDIETQELYREAIHQCSFDQVRTLMQNGFLPTRHSEWPSWVIFEALEFAQLDIGDSLDRYCQQFQQLTRRRLAETILRHADVANNIWIAFQQKLSARPP